jgi:polyferredoxin
MKRKVVSRERNWITARKATQVAALCAFFLLFVASRRGGWPAWLVNVPMRLDPLNILAQLFSAQIPLVSGALALITVGLTLVFGRAWCGWLCPMGTVVGAVKPAPNGKSRYQVPEGWRRVKYILLFTLLAAAVFGNLTLLIFDPLTLMFRTLSASVWPGLDHALSATEAVLYQLPFLSGAVSLLDSALRPVVFSSEPIYYKGALLFAGLFAFVLGLNWIAERFWCRYLCPLGGFLGLLSKFSLYQRRVGQGCKGCGLCEPVCPTGTIDPQRGHQSDPSECVMCLDCLDTCAKHETSFAPQMAHPTWSGYDPGRRELLGSVLTAAAGVSLLNSQAVTKRETPFHILPPGGRENNLLIKCLRCGECLRTCPTNAIQFSIDEAGLEGLFTPVLNMRGGYCDFSCNACGQVCPVEAIPPLNLEEKRLQVIGKAYIIQNRCIPWSNHTDCIVCEEMCPLSEKAIVLEEKMTDRGDGQFVMVKLPTVLRDLCIGCGICEYKCPLNGEAAIRVYVPDTKTAF